MLKYKFIIPLLLLIFAAVSSVSVLTFMETSRALKRVILEDLQRSATLLKNSAEAWNEDRHSDLVALAQNEILIKSVGKSFISKASRKIVEKRFIELVDNSASLDGLFLVNAEGVIFAGSSDAYTGSYRRAEDEEAILSGKFLECLEQVTAATSDPKQSTKPKRSTSLEHIAKQVTGSPEQIFETSYREDGRFRYVLVIRLYAEDKVLSTSLPVDGYLIADINVQSLVSELFSGVSFGLSGYAELYGKEGIRIESIETQGRGAPLNVNELAGEVADNYTEVVNKAGVKKVVVLKNLGTLPWTVAVQMERGEFIKPAYKIAYHISVIGALVIVLAGILTMVVLHWVLKPIASLVDTARTVAVKKDYSLRANKYSNDELGVLVDSFNGMLAEIEGASDKLEKAKEEADKANLMKRQFLATMSHEIRTPMNGIFGMTELLLATKLSEKQKGYAQTVINSADSLLNILNDILDFSKIEAGKMELDYAPLDLMAVVDDLAELMAIKARDKAIELIVRYRADTPQYFLGDHGRIRQVLSNLLSNAVKFTEKGYVLIEVEEIAGNFTTVDEHSIRISIQDTGIGIAEDVQSMIFEKFAQADSTTTRTFGGTGLGLAICKELSLMMGGDIVVESELGKGATFIFTLILAGDKDREDSDDDDTADVLKDVRILIVDDIEVNCDLLSDFLLTLNMRCDVCQDSREALGIMRKAAKEDDPYQMVIVDYLMPHLNGEDLGTMIKQDKGISDAALIMLTSAGGVIGYSRRFHDAGYASFLNKPIRQKELLHTMAHVWKRYQAGDHTSLIYVSGMSDLAKSKAYENIKFEKLNILLAEDDRTNQNFAIEILESANCNVRIATNGEEAMDIARKENVDFIFMDCEMPVMNGYEASKTLSGLMDEGVIPSVPIVALTANVMKEDRDRCLDAGMVDYLSKPMRKADMLAMVAKWLPERIDEESREIERFDGYHVLLVEDNLTNRVMIEEILVSMGFTVSLATNGRMAVDVIKRLTVDMILMDIQMPVMDGLEATVKIKELIKEGLIESVPIIALTANAMRGDREKCFKAGMCDYLPKPIRKATLHETLSKWLETRAIDTEGYYVGVDGSLFPVLDQDVLDRYKQTRKKAFIKDTESFLYQARLSINKIQEAWEKTDVETINKSSLELQKSCSQIGAKQLAHLAELLASAAESYKEENPSELRQINRYISDFLEKGLKNIAPLLDDEIHAIKKSKLIGEG